MKRLLSKGVSQPMSRGVSRPWSRGLSTHSTPTTPRRSGIQKIKLKKPRTQCRRIEQPMSSQPKRITFQSQFQLFSKFGDRDSDGRHIKLSQSDKWMRQAKVIDGKKITSTDTGICFKKFKQQKLSEDDYNLFIEDLATSKGFDVSELKVKMVNCGPPGFSSSVNNSKATGAVERLTDPAKYTGSHKERFDESGKGKGLAGRREDVDSSGYVSGYANKDTYDKEHKTTD